MQICESIRGFPLLLLGMWIVCYKNEGNQGNQILINSQRIVCRDRRTDAVWWTSFTRAFLLFSLWKRRRHVCVPVPGAVALVPGGQTSGCSSRNQITSGSGVLHWLRAQETASVWSPFAVSYAFPWSRLETWLRTTAGSPDYVWFLKVGDLKNHDTL